MKYSTVIASTAIAALYFFDIDSVHAINPALVQPSSKIIANPKVIDNSKSRTKSTATKAIRGGTTHNSIHFGDSNSNIEPLSMNSNSGVFSNGFSTGGSQLPGMMDSISSTNGASSFIPQTNTGNIVSPNNAPINPSTEALNDNQFYTNTNNDNGNNYSNAAAFGAGMFAMAGLGAAGIATNKALNNRKASASSKKIAGGKFSNPLIGKKGNGNNKNDKNGKKDTRIPSKAFPKGFAPAHLDGTLVGDVGFDPFGFGKKDVKMMRDAELKHGRIAMLAAAGWPLSELWHKQIAEAINEPSILTDKGLAPSLLNGYTGDPAWIAGAAAFALAIGSFFETNYPGENPDNPGDKGWDPLNLKDKNLRKADSPEQSQFEMELAELKHGRLAMLAITAFVFQEIATKVPVVEETPQFF